ncbi:hypothetical protein AB6A40_006756 [Gnathostoma spinigerum]|uniref:Transmembrane protein 256 n=1 Tax=Gnathostoma spinigerum TaxID=75299 RepID=A0ABD6EU21_9BILA
MDQITSFVSSYNPFRSKQHSIHPPSLRGVPSEFRRSFDHYCSKYPGMIRIAGISGAMAVILGAYGAHSLRERSVIDERRLRAFDTANRYHLLHSIALLGAPQSRHPVITAALFVGGILIFSGTCYHYSLTGKEALRRFTPIGGVMFILAWLSFIF